MEWWSNFVEGLKTFWNQPVPIIGFTVGTLVVAFLTILSKTSFGKRAIKELKNMFSTLKNMWLESKNNYDKIVAIKDEEIKILTETYESKLAVIQAENIHCKDIIIEIAENINNVKVKEIIKKYKNEASTPIEMISTDTYDKAQTRIKELEEEIVRLKNEIAETTKEEI